MMMNARLRAFVVDDEPLAIKRLVRLLSESGRVEVVGTATDPAEAVTALGGAAIDVLFLDIEMPGLTGFQLLEHLASPPVIVFTTAYDRYALQAFETNSIDYLLKPITRERLAQALDKLDRLRPPRKAELQTALEAISLALRAPRPRFPERIASRTGDRTQLVDISRVSHFYAEDKLTFAAIPPRPVVIDETLNDLEARLDPKRFVRIHRATLVNVAFIAELHSVFSGASVRLKDAGATELPVARDRVKLLKERLGI